MYNRYHLPGASLPALPARCIAEFCDIAVTCNVSIPVDDWKDFILHNPQSIIYRILFIVTEVSAILVAKITFRTSDFSKAFN